MWNASFTFPTAEKQTEQMPLILTWETHFCTKTTPPTGWSQPMAEQGRDTQVHSQETQGSSDDQLWLKNSIKALLTMLPPTLPSFLLFYSGPNLYCYLMASLASSGSLTFFFFHRREEVFSSPHALTPMFGWNPTSPCLPRRCWHWSLVSKGWKKDLSLLL